MNYENEITEPLADPTEVNTAGPLYESITSTEALTSDNAVNATAGKTDRANAPLSNSDSQCDKTKSDSDDLTPEGAVVNEEGCENASDEFTLEGDISTLLRELPSLRATLGGGINGARYSELRRLGLSAKEAYLAASAPRGIDSRSHMVTGVPLGASSPGYGMSSSEMELARELFSAMPESEIKRLYAKVTK